MGNALANDEELAAAQADVAANPDPIPDLDESPPAEVVPIVIPTVQSKSSADSSATSETASAAEGDAAPTPDKSAATPTVTGSGPTDGKQLLERFKKAKKSAEPADSAAATNVVAPRPILGSTSVAAPPAPKIERPSRIIPLLDATFRFIDRPFFWIPAQFRGILGTLALVTIVISVAAGSLLPLLISRKDVTDFIRERREAAERPVPVVAGATASAEGHGKSTEGHEKPEKKEAAHGEKKAAGHGDAEKKSEGHGGEAKKGHGEESKKEAPDHGGAKAKSGEKPKSGGEHGDAKKDAHGKKPAKGEHGGEKKSDKGGPH